MQQTGWHMSFFCAQHDSNQATVLAQQYHCAQRVKKRKTARLHTAEQRNQGQGFLSMLSCKAAVEASLKPGFAKHDLFFRPKASKSRSPIHVSRSAAVTLWCTMPPTPVELPLPSLAAVTAGCQGTCNCMLTGAAGLWATLKPFFTGGPFKRLLSRSACSSEAHHHGRTISINEERRNFTATETCHVYQGIDAMHALPQMWIAVRSGA